MRKPSFEDLALIIQLGSSLLDILRFRRDDTGDAMVQPHHVQRRKHIPKTAYNLTFDHTGGHIVDERPKGDLSGC